MTLSPPSRSVSLRQGPKVHELGRTTSPQLLADDGADRALEDAPPAGDAQAGTALHERAEEFVAMEGGEERGRIVRQIEDAPHGRGHAASRPAHMQRERVLGRVDGDRGAGGDPRVRVSSTCSTPATARDARKSRTCGQS